MRGFGYVRVVVTPFGSLLVALDAETVARIIAVVADLLERRLLKQAVYGWAN